MNNFISAEFGKADFVLLDKVTKEAFMANLKLRYQKGKVYSYIGDVVVSVNPYRNLVIYDKEYVDVSEVICSTIVNTIILETSQTYLCLQVPVW